MTYTHIAHYNRYGFVDYFRDNFDEFLDVFRTQPTSWCMVDTSNPDFADLNEAVMDYLAEHDRCALACEEEYDEQDVQLSLF